MDDYHLAGLAMENTLLQNDTAQLKLHKHPMGLEPTTLPSILLLILEEVSFKLKLIGSTMK